MLAVQFVRAMLRLILHFIDSGDFSRFYYLENLDLAEFCYTPLGVTTSIFDRQKKMAWQYTSTQKWQKPLYSS